MAIKYYCDTCGKEIGPVSQINPQPIATIEVIDPKSGQQTSQMLCKECTPVLETWVKDKQKENGVVAVSKDLNLKIQK